MSHKRLSCREEFINHLHEHHSDICDVILVPKSSTDNTSDGPDARSDGPASRSDACDAKSEGSGSGQLEAPSKAHSLVLSCYSSVLKEKLKATMKSSEELYIVAVDLDVSAEAIQVFVNCLYRKPIRSYDQATVRDVLKMASLYKVPLFIFEELFSGKSTFLCLDECLKREKQEAEKLLESCKEMLETNCAVYEDQSLFQDLNVNLIKWIADLNELSIPSLSTYAIDFAMDQNSMEILSKVRANLENKRGETRILKVEKVGNYLPAEKFSVRYKHDETLNDVLLKASSYSAHKFSPQHSRLFVKDDPVGNKKLEMSSDLAACKIEPGQVVTIEVENQMKIRAVDGTEHKIFIDFDAKRIRDLKVQISDLFETRDINKIQLVKRREVVDDMKSLDEVLRAEEEKVLSVFILGDPVDAEQVVVGYGEENVAAWAGVVITAVSSVEGSEPAMALSNEEFWESLSNGFLGISFESAMVAG